jgi:hypothetical protein
MHLQAEIDRAIDAGTSARDRGTVEWALLAGDEAALMAFNGAHPRELRALIGKRWPGPEDIDRVEFWRLARRGYALAMAELLPHRDRGWLARRCYDGALAFVKAGRLADVRDAGWNHVKRMHGIPV